MFVFFYYTNSHPQLYSKAITINTNMLSYIQLLPYPRSLANSKLLQLSACAALNQPGNEATATTPTVN